MTAPFIAKRGIPTLYRGRRYRSRLEARWAVFFDLAGWRYEYEPFDLHGWIPDFALPCAPQSWPQSNEEGDIVYDAAGLELTREGPSQILVEIKPTFRLEDFPIGKIERALRGTEQWGCEILLLGNGIFIPSGDDDYWHGTPTVGWLGQFCPYALDNGYWYSNATMDNYKGRLDFFHDAGDYTDRIYGTSEGGHKHSLARWDLVQQLWNQAGNAVQWKAPR